MTDSTKTNQTADVDSDHSFKSDVNQTSDMNGMKSSESHNPDHDNVGSDGVRSFSWHRFLFGAVMIPLLTIGAMIIGEKFDASEENLEAGFVLLTKDESRKSKHHVLKFAAGTTQTRILVWDYAAEDGDWVSIKVGGVVHTSPFMITHAPKEIVVPVGKVVEVVGERDGGGGITYAVNFPSLRKSILNGVKENVSNQYTLNIRTK